MANRIVKVNTGGTGGSQTLQQVTDLGNTTTNSIDVIKSSDTVGFNLISTDYDEPTENLTKVEVGITTSNEGEINIYRTYGTLGLKLRSNEVIGYVSPEGGNSHLSFGPTGDVTLYAGGDSIVGDKNLYLQAQASAFFGHMTSGSVIEVSSSYARIESSNVNINTNYAKLEGVNPTLTLKNTDQYSAIYFQNLSDVITSSITSHDDNNEFNIHSELGAINLVAGFTASAAFSVDGTSNQLTSSVPFRMVSGSVLTPSYSFASDNDSGFYLKSASNIAVSIAQQEKVIFNSIGISVNGGTSNINIGSGFGSGYNGIWLNGGNATTDYNMLSSSADKILYFNRPTGNTIEWRYNSSSVQMRLNTNGCLGIGENVNAGATLPAGMSATTPRVIEVRSISTVVDSGIFIRRSDGSTGLDIWQSSGSGDVYFDRKWTSGSGGSPALIFRDGSTQRMRLANGGALMIGPQTALTYSATLLDVYQPASGFAFIAGANQADNARTNNLYKFSRWGAPHYTNAEEPVTVVTIGSDGTDNIITYGGGTAVGNSATQHKWYLGANHITTSGTLALTLAASALTFADTVNIAFNTTTGSKIGTATSQKFAFWNASPIVQPTTAFASATYVSVSGTTLKENDTFDGYTIGQLVKIVRSVGLAA